MKNVIEHTVFYRYPAHLHPQRHSGFASEAIAIGILTVPTATRPA
jgi:hypothetical protein